MTKTICVLTGTRAEYGLLKPILNAINAHPNLNLKLIVTGIHLSKEFGYTINEIKKDGFNIDSKVKMNPDKDDELSMTQSIGKGIIGISNSLKKIKPDIFLVLGDRIEALAGTIAAAYLNIPIAHIHGGDSTKGGLDESARHAITKFAHIHFPVTKTSAKRIKQLGEKESNIFVVGAPGLDTILKTKLLSELVIKKKYGLNGKQKFALLIQHSVSTQPTDASKQIIETLKAIQTIKIPTIIIFPNSDVGGREIIKEIKKTTKNGFIKAYSNIPHKDYLSLMKYASIMIGNSSSGIMESASFKLPVVNIGIRQEGRERANNIIDVKHNKKLIEKAINKALSKSFQKTLKTCKSPYGNGTAGKKIAKILGNIKLDKKLLQKQITY